MLCADTMSLMCETTCFCLPLKMMVINCLSSGCRTRYKQLNVKKESFGLLIRKNVVFNGNEALKLATESWNLLGCILFTWVFRTGLTNKC